MANDILYQNKKLAGILIDLQADANGSCEVVIDIGLNVNIHTAPSAMFLSLDVFSQITGKI